MNASIAVACAQAVDSQEKTALDLKHVNYTGYKIAFNITKNGGCGWLFVLKPVTKGERRNFAFHNPLK